MYGNDNTKLQLYIYTHIKLYKYIYFSSFSEFIILFISHSLTVYSLTLALLTVHFLLSSKRPMAVTCPETFVSFHLPHVAHTLISSQLATAKARELDPKALWTQMSSLVTIVILLKLSAINKGHSNLQS